MALNRLPEIAAAACAGQAAALALTGNLSVGIDLVKTSSIAESLEQFGQRFLERIFTTAEVAYALDAPAFKLERLAARFAAKEAAMKALQLTNLGVAWTDIEVVREPSGNCELNFKGAAQVAVLSNGIVTCLSMSHEGEYATAIVIAQRVDRH
jgi:holo-[acyl-carrier protein] synthase